MARSPESVHRHCRAQQVRACAVSRRRSPADKLLALFQRAGFPALRVGCFIAAGRRITPFWIQIRQPAPTLPDPRAMNGRGAELRWPCYAEPM
ncbi:MAG: hypothetical protein IPL59_24980 [Candidatus Competibacteraceae bacterium]|nr:hypothetical protein [Candidatus Competibacteraceae bacterium]